VIFSPLLACFMHVFMFLNNHAFNNTENNSGYGTGHTMMVSGQRLGRSS